MQANLSKKGGTVHVPVFVLSHMAISALLVLVHLQPKTGGKRWDSEMLCCLIEMATTEKKHCL